jgi:nucleoside-diphosphate-sugar epimerase
MLPLYGGNLFNLNGIEDSVEFVHGDIRDEAVVERALDDVDFVFDLAAQVSYVHSNRDPLLDVDINCRGQLVVLEACRRLNTKAKVVFSSSRFVYGTTEYSPVDEGHPTNCRSIYGIHKLTAEKYMQFYHSAYGIDTACVRIANPYGPRQQMKHSSYGIVNWFVRLALDGAPLTIYGEGEQIRDYVYVEDLAKALLATALSEHTSGQIFNVGSGTGTRFREMVELIALHIPGTKILRVPWPAERYFVETGDYISDISRIHAATGWTPDTSFERGIEMTIQYYKEFQEYYWTQNKEVSSNA